MTLLHTARFAGWIRGHLLCRVEDVPGRVALTFDDGPSPVYTPRVLDVLAHYGARATFFTLARNVARSHAIVRRMLAEGHELALHGDLHWPLPLLTPGLIAREIRRSAAALAAVPCPPAQLYRPPFGFMVPSQARFVESLGYRAVLGDVYPEDTYRPGTHVIVERVRRRLQAGSILIMHDGSPYGEADRSQTVAALERILQDMRARALAGVSVSELLGSAPVVPAPDEHQALERCTSGGTP